MIIALSKIDLVNEKQNEIINLIKKETNITPVIFSSFSGVGLKELIKVLFKECEKNDD